MSNKIKLKFNLYLNLNLKKIIFSNIELTVKLDLGASLKDRVISTSMGLSTYSSITMCLRIQSILQRILGSTSWRPSIKNVENQETVAGSLYLLHHNRSEAPRQRLWLHGADQGSTGNPNDSMVNKIANHYTRKSGFKAVLRSFGFVDLCRDCYNEMIEVLKL
jgi:hypothetical protein